MGPLGSGRIPYSSALAAVGQFIAKKNMSDVCVLEFEHGLIVSGSVIFVAGENYRREVETHVFSEDDLRHMIKGA